MLNDNKKFSLQNFKNNVKKHKVKFVLNCVFIVLSVAFLIFFSVLSFSNRGSKTASALSNESRAYQYPEFDSSTSIFMNAPASYNIPYFDLKPSIYPCTALLSLRNPDSSFRFVYFDSFYISRSSDVQYMLKYSGRDLSNNNQIDGGNLVAMEKSGDKFICTSLLYGYASIVPNPPYNSGNALLFRILPQIPIYNTLYQQGLADGSLVGSQNSYDQGYASGYNTALTDKFTNPVNLILQPVSSFLETNLFGGVSIGGILSVAIFVGLALIFIKMFAGG